MHTHVSLSWSDENMQHLKTFQTFFMLVSNFFIHFNFNLYSNYHGVERVDAIFGIYSARDENWLHFHHLSIHFYGFKHKGWTFFVKFKKSFQKINSLALKFIRKCLL